MLSAARRGLSSVGVGLCGRRGEGKAQRTKGKRAIRRTVKRAPLLGANTSRWNASGLFFVHREIIELLLSLDGFVEQ